MFGCSKKALAALITGLAWLVFAFPVSGRAQGNDTGNLEIPAAGSIQSGIGIVSGWKCTSNGLTARFDGGDELPIAYGTPRGDTLGRCPDENQQNTAFALQWNYSNLTDGEHLVEILDGGEVWRSAIFRVQRVAGAKFLRGVENCTGLEDFPGVGNTQYVEWQQASQSFVLVSDCDTQSTASVRSGMATAQQAVPGALENPGPGAKMSGIGIVSGWRCAGGNITARFNDGDPIQVAYGTPRGDTRGQCADTERVNNAYVLQWNYALLGDGEHTLRLFDDGVEFASSTFSVQTLGAPFVRDLSGDFLIRDFPEAGDEVVIEWQQGKQGFGVVLSVTGGPTPTPTPTPTPEPTSEPTPTPTPMPTPTPTPEPTPEPLSYTADVWPILSSCSACHGASGNFEITSSSSSVVNVVSIDNPPEVYVVPGNPGNSFLLAVLTSDAGGKVYTQMPPSGPYLNENQINVITAWILEGANP